MEKQKDDYIKHLEKTNNALIETISKNTNAYEKTFRILLVAIAVFGVLFCMFTLELNFKNNTNMNINSNYNHNGGSENG